MEEQIPEQYTKGFNNGYLIAKHDPALASQLAANPNEHNEYFKGFLGGKAEHDREIREWSRGFSKGTPTKEDRGLDKER